MCGRPETDAERNASDLVKLRAAINRCESVKKDWCEDAKTIMAAARKHLHTLPKTKKRWGVSIGGGWVHFDYLSQAMDAAKAEAEGGRAVTVELRDAPI